MKHYVYFLIGILLAFVIIKIILPNPITFKLNPTLKNYNDVTYIDEEGKLYKYELYTVK